jgi:hypothetical protein
LPETLIVPRKLTELGRRGPWALTALPVAPPASVLRGWQWAIDPMDATELLFAAGGGTNVLRGTVVLRGAGPARTDKGPPLPCTIDEWSAGDISLTCFPDLDGYAVISSSASAGWAVTIDGTPSVWLTADVLRRAVKIEPGRHTIRWTYATPGGPFALVAALFGLVVLAALLAFALHRR